LFNWLKARRDLNKLSLDPDLPLHRRRKSTGEAKAPFIALHGL
jgi:hypothetical protein